jgi:ubiquinone/menaquinone biosynthesis C-methylase UbiE
MPFFLDRVTEKLKIPRHEILSPLEGHILEIGIGTGANLGKYPVQVRKVTGVEPDQGSLGRCMKKWNGMNHPHELELVHAGAEELPFEDASFDGVLSSLVFCSIPDPLLAAREVFRVLKPNGIFVFFEHVLDPDPRIAKWQYRLNPIWRRFSCGCQMTRKTADYFEEAGFVFSKLDAYVHSSMGPLFSSVQRGIAVKP